HPNEPSGCVFLFARATAIRKVRNAVECFLVLVYQVFQVSRSQVSLRLSAVGYWLSARNPRLLSVGLRPAYTAVFATRRGLRYAPPPATVCSRSCGAFLKNVADVMARCSRVCSR